jgi:branched-chain amino acid aminotransferase
MATDVSLDDGPRDPVPSDLGWLDGRFLPRSRLALSPIDGGFVLGAAVAEQLRTFRGELFLPEEHAERLAEGLSIVGIESPWPIADLFAAAAELARHNWCLGPESTDLGVSVVVTPGDLASQSVGRPATLAFPGRARAMIHSFPLAFASWAQDYDRGVRLVTVSVRQVPQACWPSRLKCRSRMHYHLAEREAHGISPGSRPLVCHDDGRISETPTANVVAVADGRLVSPPETDALPGVSLGFLRRLAEAEGLPWLERPLSIRDCLAADELLLTSTPSCLLPAVSLDGAAIGAGVPGPMFHRLLTGWSRSCGMDIRRQAWEASDGSGNAGDADATDRGGRE